jgi:hypothetical protein
MSKVVLTLFGKKIILEHTSAMKVMELVGDCEVFETKWNRDADDTYHVYKPNPQEILHNSVSVAPLPLELYEIAKLAGRPDR